MNIEYNYIYIYNFTILLDEDKFDFIVFIIIRWFVDGLDYDDLKKNDGGDDFYTSLCICCIRCRWFFITFCLLFSFFFTRWCFNIIIENEDGEDGNDDASAGNSIRPAVLTSASEPIERHHSGRIRIGSDTLSGTINAVLPNRNRQKQALWGRLARDVALKACVCVFV